jgi:hypothetical protein
MQIADGREVRWATAVRILDAQYRVSSWYRLACVGVLWALLPSVDAAERLRVAAQLIVVTAGVLVAYIYARPELIDRLAQLPHTDWIVGQLSGDHGRAEINLPGLLEGAGILVAATAYLGPWAASGPTGSALIAALLATTYFAWSCFQNVVMDSGYYAPAAAVVVGLRASPGPPARWLVSIRYAVPVGLTLIAAVLFIPPWTDELAAAPVAIRAVLGLSFLTLYLRWVTFEAVLTSSAETVTDSQNGVRRNAAQDLHSLAKNAVVSILNAVEAPRPRPAEVRGLVRNTLVQLEEVRRSWLRPELTKGQRPLHELWEAAMAILAPAWRLRCSLAEPAGALELQSTDQQLVRRLLSDLVVNALAPLRWPMARSGRMVR